MKKRRKTQGNAPLGLSYYIQPIIALDETLLFIITKLDETLLLFLLIPLHSV